MSFTIVYGEAEREARIQEKRDFWESRYKENETYGALFKEYKEARDLGNVTIDFAFSEFFQGSDIDETNSKLELAVACMRENGLTTFTMSCRSPLATQYAWIFQQYGCVLDKVVQIYGETDSLRDPLQIPALLFHV